MHIPKVQFNPQSSGTQGIEVFELEQLYQRESTLNHNPAEPHRVEFHCLLYITSGKSRHLIDFNEVDIQAGSFLFIHKNQVQAFDLKTKPQGYILLFTDEFFDEIRSNFRIPSLIPSAHPHLYQPVISLKNELKTSCKFYLSELIKDQTADKLLTQLLFTTLYIKVVREMPDISSSRLSKKRIDTFNRFIQLLGRGCPISRDASEYAHQLNITYKSLNEICKLATDLTAKQLIDAEVILEAKRKLTVENLQIQALAYDLGFIEVTNFVKYFKKHTTLTPSQFQKKSKG